MKKRILSVFLCLVLVAAVLFAATVFADVATVIACSNEKATAGDTVSVKLSIRNNTGFMSLNLGVVYNKQVLELLEIKNEIPGFTMTAESSVVWDGAKNYSQDGEIAELKFKVKEDATAGDYNIRINFFEASDYDGNSVFALTENGTITVTEVSNEVFNPEPELPQTDKMIIYAENAISNPDGTFSIDLKTKQNKGFMALNIAVIYDKSNMELLSIENKISGFVMSAETSIVWDGSRNYSIDGTIATLTFKVNKNANAGEYEIKVKFFDASDYDGNYIDAVGVSGKVFVENTLPGDINDDGVLDINDVCLIMLKADSFDRRQFLSADLDKNGVIDNRDAAILANIIARK